MRKRYTGVVAIAGLVLALLAGVIACGERAGAPQTVGYLFPAVPLANLTGKDVVSPDALRGKARVVNFWATWCEPCRKEMPSLQRLHQLADPAKLSVIGFSVDTDLNLAREFLLQHKLTFPNYSDAEQKLARDALMVQAFPVTFLVAADGTVRARITGARDWASPDTLRLLAQTLNTPVAEK
jgi:thiol-disulfide isomerase/thioredoxin